MARPGESSTAGPSAIVPDKRPFAAFENLYPEEPPPRRSRILPILEEIYRKNDARDEKKETVPEEDTGLQEDGQAPDREEVPGAGVVEPATLAGVDAPDNGDNGLLHDDQGNIVHRIHKTTAQVSSIDLEEQEVPEELGEPGLLQQAEGSEQHASGAREEAMDDTHETSVRHNSFERFPNGMDGQSVEDPEKEALNETPTMCTSGDDHEQALHNTREETDNHDYQPLDGTCEEPVASSPDNQFLEGTHEEPGNVNRDNSPHDGTCDEPVVNEGEGTFEGTREGTVDNMCEKADGGGTLVEDASETGGDLVPGEHDEPPSVGSHEATTTGAPQDSSSRHEPESHSESRSSPRKRRGKPKWAPLPEFNNLRPTL